MPPYDDTFSPAAPIARVSLRHRGSGRTVPDVPMLIDSGADVTLNPKSSVDLPGLEITCPHSRRTAPDLERAIEKKDP